MTVTVTLMFANAAAAAAALARIDAENTTPLPVLIEGAAQSRREMEAATAEKQAPKSAPAPKAKPADTPPSAATAQTDAPAPAAEEFKYETLRAAALPLIPKLGAGPFNEIAGEFGFASLKDLGAKGTPAQWSEAHAKVLALAAA